MACLVLAKNNFLDLHGSIYSSGGAWRTAEPAARFGRELSRPFPRVHTTADCPWVIRTPQHEPRTCLCHIHALAAVRGLRAHVVLLLDGKEGNRNMT